jgi:hypothetical protein
LSWISKGSGLSGAKVSAFTTLVLPSHLEKKDLESTMAVQWINLLVKKNINMFLSAKQFLSTEKKFL